MTGLAEPTPATAAVQQVMTAGGMNAIRDALNFTLNPPHFRGSITAATALTIATNVPYPSVEDNYAGWNAANHYWVVPAGCGGLYQVFIQFKWNGAPASAPSCKILGGAANATPLRWSPNASAFGALMGISLSGFIRVAAGDQISVQLLGAGFTTQADPADNNYFDLGFYSI